MTGTTDDPTDPRLGRGTDSETTSQHEVYLVLSKEERARGFVRPLRESYRHVGPAGPTHDLQDLTEKQKAQYSHFGYVKYEKYPPGSAVVGRYWTKDQLDRAGRGGCGTTTRMSRPIAETYAREPKFYGSTYCVTCQRHLPVEEFRWEKDDQVVGS